MQYEATISGGLVFLEKDNVRKFSLYFIVIATLAFFFPCHTLSKPRNTAEIEYNSLHATERSTFRLSEVEQRNAISQAYEQGFRQKLSDTHLRSASDDDLIWFIKAASLASVYSRQPLPLQDLRLILSESERRGITTDDQRTTFYRVLIGYRQFDEARDYLDKHPSLDVEQPPAIGVSTESENGKEQAYVVDQEQHRLLPHLFHLSEGTHLIVISHPLCAFSRSAMETVETDPELSQAFDGVATWLTPVDTRLHFNKVQTWNRDHPKTQVVIARHRQDWPMIDSWATPNFYLLRNGEVLDHFSGWPRDGSNRERLIQMLNRGSLLPRPQ
ncbi:hypothetical protein [Marilutibacter alkalisoli]|uniref:Uncharacterized protein n=1 Tax=Marilutibacter alkalisoli TaxID=2591633 RepID=A0A514BNZ8_9GAMM|nr:hypothetical protein [Lysobacter alkalisoli]QDH69114.1 hypothetical protein FKV23_02590 [Lysobacter alkalisoli]